ncbi:MAG: TetM/TetW/TetO/TetS family tetracycline resistance ribosomal protection protein [Lachnospiraceae bacterium]|nr:TetM/TetW/TetO/TetS family tetracycline resistance ribosomal protection protein [Lachnospiraceae bacterium]
MMKNTTIGIIAHVDAGKTTLSEALLYLSGTVGKMGRVDKGDAFLDTHDLERKRGITIFSKQARFTMGDRNITLLDTPGHVDFSGEMERVLSVLDYAILVINGADGVQSHTKTVWRLLCRYNIPTFVFINKMDRADYLSGRADSHMEAGKVRSLFISDLSDNLSGSFIDFSDETSEDFLENVALTDEEVMNRYLEGTPPDEETIAELIAGSRITPVFFGSALKNEGVREFMESLDTYMMDPDYPEGFGAAVYKITRDSEDVRLTHVKITGGSLKVRDVVETRGDDGEVYKEKITGIRLYSGEKYEAVGEAFPGDICALTGLKYTKAGDGLGEEEGFSEHILEPVLTYKVFLPSDIAPSRAMDIFKLMEEEDPQLNVFWNEELSELTVRVMGDIQVEILKEILKERFDLEADFGTGRIVYKETIRSAVYGAGHFEPLRHYAEVHLLMEPLPRGSGIVIGSNCSEEVLAKNWQRLIMTHLREKTHKGVLTGSAITDMKITLVSGRSHLKHTEGGDFRQATYRAVRQGLMEAESVLLEPYYDFVITVPAESLGRVMTDIDGMCGEIEPPETDGAVAILRGKAPVSLMMDYQKEVMAFTGGEGHIELSPGGYMPCHNEADVLEKISYDPERDMRNPTGSVFCEKGAGVYVPWNEVKSRCDADLPEVSRKNGSAPDMVSAQPASSEELWIDTEEVDSIISNAGGANRKPKFIPHKGINRGNHDNRVKAPTGLSKPGKQIKKEKYLLVDGYNVIYAWDELKDLADATIDGARDRLAEILDNYRAITGTNLILVFDAYRIAGHRTEQIAYGGISIVYTKEAETADQYIEKFAHKNASNYDITVATSDGLEQIIIRGAGCGLISARELKEEVKRANRSISL